MDYVEETFKIKDDKTADWAITQIHEAENERDRLIALAEEQISDLKHRIEELQTKCDNETKFLRSCLEMYFDTVTTKETKTQKTYKLLSGTLVFKKPSVKINHDDEKLLDFLDGTEFVETKRSLKWGEYKKLLSISGNDVIDTETGEIVEACSIEDVPASFTIKF